MFDKLVFVEYLMMIKGNAKTMIFSQDCLFQPLQNAATATKIHPPGHK